MCNLDEVRIMLLSLVWNVDIVSDISSPVLVYEKFHVFALSCWNGILNSCNDLIDGMPCEKIRITKAPDGDLKLVSSQVCRVAF